MNANRVCFPCATTQVYKLLETITYHPEKSFSPTLCVSIAMKHCVCKTYPLDYDPRKTLEIRITERECDVSNCPNNYKNQQNLDDPDWSMYATPHENRRSPRSRQSDQSVFRYIVKALSDSSISGVNKLFSSKTLLQKTLWLIVLTSCLSGFSYQTYQFSKLYRKKPSVVQIEVENDGLAEFPAVTLCNTNRLVLYLYSIAGYTRIHAPFQHWIVLPFSHIPIDLATKYLFRSFILDP
ncbi:hypothetical protein AVEN_126444-1 [Araneus ventricosus]|uniref:Uncharacterized protein n=1 Tax=Araneus ventricosus TaxID=182803 RepID=A0A4Y2DJ35_ARAVE|nr:hypothetical protein AVEN_126444-1 [Araneus ventricosus]